MYMAKDEGKEDDWFSQLDAELEKKTTQIADNFIEQANLRATINGTMLEDFFRIWLRFNKITVHLTVSPEPSTFIHFVVYPDQWNVKEDADFAAMNNMSLTDRTQDQGRVGDSVKAWYYSVDSTSHFRMVFEYCEGEHYYKYAGWKRIFTQHVLMDVPVAKWDEKKFHEVLADMVKTWYESHLRRDRDIIIKHVRDKYEKGETFTQ